MPGTNYEPDFDPYAPPPPKVKSREEELQERMRQDQANAIMQPLKQAGQSIAADFQNPGVIPGLALGHMALKGAQGLATSGLTAIDIGMDQSDQSFLGNPLAGAPPPPKPPQAVKPRSLSVPLSGRVEESNQIAAKQTNLGDRGNLRALLADPNTPLELKQMYQGLLTQREAEAPKVQATINGKTYDYTSSATDPERQGQDQGQGGAPLLEGQKYYSMGEFKGQPYMPVQNAGVSAGYENANLRPGPSVEQQGMGRDLLTARLRNELAYANMPPGQRETLQSLSRPENPDSQYIALFSKIAKHQSMEVASFLEMAHQTKMTPDQITAGLGEIEQRWKPWNDRLDAYKRTNSF